jgi:taurine dioxygenase
MASVVNDLTVKRLGVALGAEVEGIDLRGPISDETKAWLRAAVFEHQVVIVRHQELTDDNLETITAFFGEPRGSEPFRSLAGCADENVLKLYRYPVKTLKRAPGTLIGAEKWHTDTTFIPNPPIAAVLYPVRLPSVGGDTAWVSLYSVYDSLSDPLKDLCSRLSGEHNWEPVRVRLEALGPQAVARAEELFPPLLHPLVQTHQVTGRKVLAVQAEGNWMERIVGLHEDEAAVLLDLLRRRLDQAEFQFRWRWSLGDVAIWDEFSTLHRGMADHVAVDPNREMRSVWAFAAE